MCRPQLRWNDSGLVKRRHRWSQRWLQAKVLSALAPLDITVSHLLPIPLESLPVHQWIAFALTPHTTQAFPSGGDLSAFALLQSLTLGKPDSPSDVNGNITIAKRHLDVLCLSLLCLFILLPSFASYGNHLNITSLPALWKIFEVRDLVCLLLHSHSLAQGWGYSLLNKGNRLGKY